ncbi:MAG: glutamate-5-semialdehyde dehydrogenase [Candidatus Nanopelagicales bacterium]
MNTNPVVESTLSVAAAARVASAKLAVLTRADKDAALLAIADALESNVDRIVTANRGDVASARHNGTSDALIDRLTLTPARIAAIAEAVRDVAGLNDPVGEVIRGYTLANGLRIRQLRVPMGVVGMIYEARPNVTVDAAVLALKSGNAALLRGSSSAYHSNVALVAVMREALAQTAVPVDCVLMVPGTTHESVAQLLTARGLVDVIIPRGGGDLIKSVIENATVPVIETGVGNCHVYVDAGADIDSAVAIVLNAKTQRPSVCNAAESLLVHADIADEFLPAVISALNDAGVTVHGDDEFQIVGKSINVDVPAATDEDWAAEYYSLDIAAGVVDSIDAAIDHIRRWSTGHTEAIVSDSAGAIERFANEVDSAAVMVNASTRFTDGAEFGFGAEIGISTQKLHARGPMGLTELTTTKYIVTGDGHVRS